MTEAETNAIGGSRELLILSLQRRYGYTRGEALGEIENFIRRMSEMAEGGPAQRASPSDQ